MPEHPPQLRRHGVLICRWFICALGFLLPLKFGVSLGTEAVARFPLGIFDWCLDAWPAALLAGLAGILLLAQLFACSSWHLNRREWLAMAAFGGLFAVSLCSMLISTEKEYAIRFLWHILSAWTLLLAAMVQKKNDPAMTFWLLLAIGGGALAVAFSGWYQTLGGGYRESIHLAVQQQAEGVEISAGVLARLGRARATGPFTGPNVFCAHLLLTLPLAICLSFKLGGRIKPPRASRLLLVGLTCFVLIGAVVLSGSRSGILAGLAGGGIIFGLACRKFFRGRKMVFAGVLLGLLTGAALLLFVSQGRSWHSLGARGEYYRASIEMFLKHPVHGVGMGEFFPWHMRLKPAGAEETRLPHSVFFLFLSQAGIIGGIAVVFWLVSSVWLTLPRPAGPPPPAVTASEPHQTMDIWIRACVSAGVLAWLFHALVNFDFQIPGTVGVFALLVGLMIVPPVTPGCACPVKKHFVRGLAFAMSLTCLWALRRLPGEKAFREFYLVVRHRGSSPELCTDLAQIVDARLPHFPHARLMLAQREARAGRNQEAIENLEIALKRSPHRGSAWYLLAGLRLRAGDIAGARNAYRQAVVWKPESPSRDILDPLLGNTGAIETTINKSETE